MTIHLTWHIKQQFLAIRRLFSQKKGSLTRKHRRELIRMCARTTQITEQITSKADCLAVFETCVCHLVGHLDRPTRDNLFEVVNMIVDANHEVVQHSLVTKKMLKSFKKSRQNVKAGLVAGELISTLIKDTEKNGIKQSARDDIFKLIIVRLAMELSHKEVNQVINSLLPGIKTKKDQEQTQFMYG